MNRPPRWMTYGEVYAYRTRKPWAPWGLPIIGRHWGYGGQTRNPAMRDREHTRGGGRYGKQAAPWSNLDPKRYVLFRLDRCPQWLLNLAERLVILVLMPVYNEKMNKHNPRRISRERARRQRYARDEFGRTYVWVMSVCRWVIWAALAALIVMAWRAIR